MKGRRFDFDPFHDDPIYLKDGDYGLWRGLWYVKTPNGLLGCLGTGSSHHIVVENPDRTITVSPSILTSGEGKTYHGFLKNGEWRDC